MTIRFDTENEQPYIDGENPNECFVPENLCEFVYRPASMNRTDPRDELIRRLVGALEFYADFESNTEDGIYQWHENGDPNNMMTLDGGEKAVQALTAAEQLGYGGGHG